MRKVFVLLTDKEIDVAPVWALRDEVRRLTTEIKRLRNEQTAQHSVQADCCPRCGSNSWRDAIVPDTLEICTVCGNSR